MTALRDFLLEPAEPRDVLFEPPNAAAHHAAAAGARSSAAAEGLGPEVAVLAPSGRVAALGAATALLLIRRRRTAAGLVIVWAPGLDRPPTSAPATRAARRLAAVLDGRGLDAVAGGRLATVVLPDEPVQAAAAATGAVAAAQGSPVVLALGGRAAPFDALLSTQDRVVVMPPAGAEPRVTELALAGLADVARDARACTAEPTAATRAFLAAGLAVPGSLRRALGPALDGLGR